MIGVPSKPSTRPVQPIHHTSVSYGAPLNPQEK